MGQGGGAGHRGPMNNCFRSEMHGLGMRLLACDNVHMGDGGGGSCACYGCTCT